MTINILSWAIYTHQYPPNCLYKLLVIARWPRRLLWLDWGNFATDWLFRGVKKPLDFCRHNKSMIVKRWSHTISKIFGSISAYLVGGWATPLKNMSSSVGMMTFPIYAKIKNGDQTTNQLYNQQTAIIDQVYKSPCVWSPTPFLDMVWNKSITQSEQTF